MVIDAGKCISCGACQVYCHTKAIIKADEGFAIWAQRCDECGVCVNKCWAHAITREEKALPMQGEDTDAG